MENIEAVVEERQNKPIEKEGMVSYKGQKNPCRYFEIDGKNYYRMDNRVLNNDTMVASTNLKEAVDPLYASEYAENVGLLDSYGKEVIPFVNKSIKPVNDDIVLVEPAHPVSQSVIDAVALKKDPLSATKLVSTPALIKDKINSKMGNNGRYVFNNQFSEATLVDVNGNNLVNNEYYSFIAMNPEKIYFSKNTTDSIVGEYSVLPSEIQQDVTPANDTNEIDVTAVDVPTETVENALTNESNNDGFDASSVVQNVNEGFASTEVTPVALGEDQMVSSVEAAPVETSVEEVTPVETNEEQNVQDTVESDEIVIPQISADETVDENTTEEVENVTEEAPVEEVTETPETVNGLEEFTGFINVPETVNPETSVEEVTPVDEIPEEVENTVEENQPEETVEENVSEEVPVEDTVEDVEEAGNVDINEELEDTTLDNMFGEVKDARDVEDDMKESIFNTSINADSISYEDEFDDSYDNNDYIDESSKGDTTMMEVAKSMAGLIKQNKELKSTNNDLAVKFEKVNASRKNVVEKARMLEEKVDVLNTKNQSLDNKIIKLESKNDMLENRTRDQERVIEAQRRELDNLRAQLEGKEELSRLLQDAKVMLEDNNTSYNYDDEDNYYRRAA